MLAVKFDPIIEVYETIVRDVHSDIVVVGSGEFRVGSLSPVVIKAVWDTGAYGTVISRRVAEELGLTPIGTKLVQTANGTYQSYVYVVDVMLPNKVVVRGVEVSESDLKVCDALIGMDIISLGDMKITNNPTTKFVFQIPSQGDMPLAGA